MIFKLCVVTLGAVVVSSGIVEAIGCGVADGSKSLTDEVFDQPSPTTMAGKCVYECMMRKIGSLGENGLIDADKFTQSLKETKQFPDATLAKMKIATDNCKNHRHFSENKCETAGLFVQCASEEAARNGLNVMAIAKSILYMYYDLPLAVQDPSIGEKKQMGTFLFNWPSIDWWPKRK